MPLCLADWVLVEDLGFLGGLGTDPNSMLPMALLFVAGYVAMVRVPGCRRSARGSRPQAQPAREAAADNGVVGAGCPLSYAVRTAAAVAALAIVLVGAAPMAAARSTGNADPILTEALDGSPNTLDSRRRTSPSPTSTARPSAWPASGATRSR